MITTRKLQYIGKVCLMSYTETPEKAKFKLYRKTAGQLHPKLAVSKRVVNTTKDSMWQTWQKEMEEEHRGSLIWGCNQQTGDKWISQTHFYWGIDKAISFHIKKPLFYWLFPHINTWINILSVNVGNINRRQKRLGEKLCLILGNCLFS